MATIDYTQFYELAEQLRGEMSLKQLCEYEGVPLTLIHSMAFKRRNTGMSGSTAAWSTTTTGNLFKDQVSCFCFDLL